MSKRRGIDRGQFLRLATSLSGAAAATATLPTAAETTGVKPPERPIAKLAQLKNGQPFMATYPDERSPIIILKLGRRVPEGVGPEGDIVAYSSFCTHMGCPVAYQADRNILSCPCHYSSFDPVRGGMQIIGQATTNLPQIILRASSGKLYAVGIRGLVWGRQTNFEHLT